MKTLLLSAMSPFAEKVFFGSIALIGTTFSTLGAIMTTGETRWVYVTFAASSMTSGFVSLMVKKDEDAIHRTLGRFGFAILGGILGTKPIVTQLGFSKLCETDIISLAGLSSAVCIGTFFVGVSFLKLLEVAAPGIAEKWLKKFL